MLLRSLPIDVLLNILPLLSVNDLISLSSTNKSFEELINGKAGEFIWRDRLSLDFSYPINNTARQGGWRSIYRKVRTSSTYVCGQNANGRLGLKVEDQINLQEGGLTTPTLLPGISYAALEASGFGFSGITFSGEIQCFGTMNGSTYVPRNQGINHPGFIFNQPTLLSNFNPITNGRAVQLAAGRKHVLFRTTREEVWEFRAYGRVYRVLDAAWKGKTIASVEGGWEHSAMLTTSGEVYIWWEFSPASIDTLAKEAGEEHLDHDTEGVTFDINTESIRLPPIPNSNDKIKSIASGDHFIYALTEKGRLVYRLDISPVSPLPFPIPAEDSPTMPLASQEQLSASFISGQRSWEYMKRFCEIVEIQKLPFFEKNPLSASTKINHISAHFQSFVAYSVPPSSSNLTTHDSIVLLGTQETSPDSAPNVIPELQGRGIIQCVSGDYHHLALTSTGQVLSWGQFSSGALGIGHPRLLGTPLYNSQTTPAQAPPVNPHRFVYRAPVAEIKTPTLIEFEGDDQVVESNRTKGKFVFSLTASGWHSGMLAFELGEGSEKGKAEKFEEKEETRDEIREEVGAFNNEARGMPRVRGLRLGFPLRGMRRGGEY